MLNKVKEILKKFVGVDQLRQMFDEQKLLAGAILAKELLGRESIASISAAEFKIFSQWGDDGIIQYLIHRLDIPNETFIEFGVADYWESNTRFLLMNNNWSGLVLDGSGENISKIKESYYYWKYDLEAVECFVDLDNINGRIAGRGFSRDVGLLHIDIDGNDYWIWEAIDVISPVIVILEYNSVFGSKRAITVPYRRDFDRSKAHYSHLYFGASLAALIHLSEKKGYRFVGSNSAGNNAYFVRSDKVNDEVRGISLDAGFRTSMYRESRDPDGKLDHKQGTERLKALEGLTVHNIITNQIEKL